MGQELCKCGSGRATVRCHGLRGRERRERSLELQALGELHDLAYLFPFVRPSGATFDAFADRVAGTIGEVMREATPIEAAEGLTLLTDNERRRIVRLWADPYPARWRHVCRSVGDVALAEVTLVTSAIRGAIADRQPCPRGVIGELEAGQFEEWPGTGLAFVIKPDTIWSAQEAYDDCRVVTEEHLARLRMQALRLQKRLPIEGLPRASARLARECELLADDGLASGVADLLFDSFKLQMSRRQTSIRSRN